MAEPVADPHGPPTALAPMQRLLLGAIRGYRFALKPWLGNACRFEPTCSAYAMQAIERHGAAVGARLAAGRLLRCHPLCAGGLDPVPEPRDRARRPAPRSAGAETSEPNDPRAARRPSP